MTDVREIQKSIADIGQFMREKYDPLAQRVDILGEENARLVDEVKGMLDTQKRQNRAALMRGLMDTNSVPTGKYRGCTPLDMAIVGKVLKGAEKMPQDLDERMMTGWRENYNEAISHFRALDSTTATKGAELTYEGLATELWRDVHLQTAVASLFPTIMMPTNPFRIPVDLQDINWYPGVSNVATTGTDTLTGDQTLTAKELVGMVNWAYDLDEDAVIAVLPEIRALLVRNAAEVLDDVILNADTTVANGINSDGTTISASTAGYAQFLLGWDGLRHIGLVDDTSQGNDHNAVTDEAMYSEIRGLLGKYGVRPDELAYIADIQTYIETIGLTAASMRTLDKYGPQATVLTGELGKIEGIPVIVSEQLRQTDDDGKVTHPFADANNDNGTLIIVNRTQYRKGFRRELLIESERDIQKRQTVMVASMRVAFDGRNANTADTAMAMQYNVT